MSKTEEKLVRFDVSQLSWAQKEAVYDYLREKREERRKEDEVHCHIVEPQSIQRVFVGSKWKPWTWFNYKWVITDKLLSESYLK